MLDFLTGADPVRNSTFYHHTIIDIFYQSQLGTFCGTRKEDGIPPVGIKVLREREKRLLLDFIRDNLKQPKKRRKE